MALRRRRLLALASAGVAPALAGCSPCGETWPGVGFDVQPLAVERAVDWRVDAELSVDFSFGPEGFGLEGAALALFDAGGALLDERPVGDVRWADVPEAERESTDCGDHATVERSATLRSEIFPRWVGLRYDRLRTDYDEPTTVARYPHDGTPGEAVAPSDYETVDAASVADRRGDRAYVAPVSGVRFDAGPLHCDERPTTAEARADGRLSIRGDRVLPADNRYPTVASLSHEGDALFFRVGWRRAPRFRRVECDRTRWAATVEFERSDAMPETVAVGFQDLAGDTVETERVAVETA